MRDNYLPWLVFWTIFCIPTLLFAQLFSDQNPVDPVVCNTASWGFSIENDQSTTLDAGTISVQFPACIFYVPGSVSGLTELDVADLNAPVFTAPILLSGMQLSVGLEQTMDCGCLDAIDMGELFANAVSYTTSGNTYDFASNQYEVNTPLLVLTSITNSFFSGNRGTVFQRILKVKNTRPGPLESFEFIDVHQGGLSIQLDAGQPLPSGGDELRVLLDGTDFQLIGDGDALFEQDEEITLIETITIEDCGVELFSSLSAITLGWGCNDEFCQVVEQSALVQILQNDLAPELQFIGQATAPVCFCGPEGHPQSLTVFNAGTDAALDLQITLLEGNAGVGLFQPSVQIDSAGQSITPLLVPGDTLQVEGLCEPPGVLLNSAILSISELQPGDTLVISWDSYFCQPDCNDAPHSWSYTYAYLKPCPPDPYVSAAGSTVVAAAGLPQILLEGPNQLVDDSMYTYSYQVLYDSLTQVSGTLELTFALPCGLSWVGGPPILGGVSPISFDQEQVADEQHFTAVYTLPFVSNAPSLSFDLQFDCGAPCLAGGDCEEQLFSSCTELECAEEGDPVLPIEVSTSVNACAPFPAECGIETCAVLTPSYLCVPDSVCLDTVPGYIAYELTAQRLTWGLPDTDNNRFADPGDPYNTALMRLDRLIAGDTFQTVLAGTVIGELPGVTFPYGLLSLEFIPSGLDAGNNPELSTPEGIQALGGQLQIWDASTGLSYTCTELPVEPFAGGFGLVYDYPINSTNLLAADCGLPAGFQFAAGDSISWTADFAVLHNPVKASPQQAFPPLIDLTIRPLAALAAEEVEERADYRSCGCSTSKMELSGFEFELFPGIFAIEPCDTSDFRGATFFEFRLAQGNFFPYEFRNLLVLEDLRITFPEVVHLIESRIDRLRLQNGPELYNDAAILGQPLGDAWTYALAPFQMTGLDEGFVFLLQYRFLPDCTLQGVYLTEVEVNLDWAAGLPAAATPPSALVVSNAIRALLPTLQMENAITYQTSLDNQLQWFFSLNNLVTTIATQNSGPAPNAWIAVENPSGLLEDFVLIDTETGQPLPDSNGIFQLGSLDTNQVQHFTLIAANNSCVEEQVLLSFGWHCSPYLHPDTMTCNQQEILFAGISPNGTLELSVEAPDSCGLLCDTVPYHFIEVFNAGLGAVCDPLLEVTLPPGFEILPGSVELSYPAGSPFVAIADPLGLGGQTYLWDLAAQNAMLDSTCLKGLGAAPENRIQLRFLGHTDCDFVLESQLLFEASGKQNCGTPANTITRQGGSVCIQTDTPADQTLLNLNVDAPVACGNAATLNIGLLHNALTEVGDSIHILLPTAITYTPGSLVPVFNSVSGEPYLELVNGNQQLSWALPEGLNPFVPIAFQVGIQGLDALPCGSYNALVQVTGLADAFCALSGETCSVAFESGSGLLEIEVEKPILQINDFSVILVDNGAEETVFFSLELQNTGLYFVQPTPVQIYLDLDQDGQFSSGDSIVFEDTYPPLGNAFTFTGAFSIPAGMACLLTAGYLAGQLCACSVEQAAVSPTIQHQSGPLYAACSGTALPIDFCPPGLSYQWEGGAGLSCYNCCSPQFTAVNMSAAPQLHSFTLTVEDNFGCFVAYPVNILVEPASGIVFAENSVCAGETALLFADDGTSYVWSGPGVSQAEEQFLQVVVQETATYYLTITDALGCVSVDSVTIEALPLPLADAGPDSLQFCPDEPFALSAADGPNLQYSWSPGILLDDPTSRTPVILNPVEGWYQVLVESPAGCQSSDSVYVSFAEAPSLGLTGNPLLCLGDADTLQASGGLSYSWTGDFPVSCLNPPLCSQVVVEPGITGTVQLIAANAALCTDTLNWLIEVVADEIQTQEQVQTCTGEPVPVFAELLDVAGIYCDTTFTPGGCLAIHCIELLVEDTIVQDLAVQLCPGETYDFGGQLLDTPGIYFDLLSTASGCDSTVRLDLSVAALDALGIDASQDSIVLGESVDFSVVGAPAGSQYAWSPAGSLSCAACAGPTAMPEETTTYILVVTAPNGCIQTLEYSIAVDKNCHPERVEIPNVFTPNNDGVNDRFGPLLPGGQEQITRFEVYNRWGQLVFDGRGALSWDGTFNGASLPADVYVYRIRVSCGEEEQLFIGELSLLR